MKLSSPTKLTIFIVIILVSIFGATILIINYFHIKSPVIPILIALGVFITASYFIVSYIFKSFIYEKIQPIYKSIHEHALSQKELRKQIQQEDFITTLNMEVKDWPHKKTKEIKRLKQMEKYRKDFVGNVSHELKTPIFNIQGYILTLLDGGLEDAKVNKLYLERAEKSINRMISIVEDLESISRLESGEMKLNFEKFNLHKMTEEVFESLEMRAKEKQIKFSLDSGSGKTPKVIGDRNRMFEVLNNLLSNSVIYGNKHGETKVSFMDMGQSLLVDVSDNGIGISEKDIPRIFERFYRTDKSRSRDQGGTGLGLAIVKHVIDAHNQTINVRSKPDKGSSFAFTIKKA